MLPQVKDKFCVHWASRSEPTTAPTLYVSCQDTVMFLRASFSVTSTFHGTQHMHTKCTLYSHGPNRTGEAGLRQSIERLRERRVTELEETREARLRRMLERASCF